MPQLRDSRALVTGAGGFVGASLVRALAAEGAEVHAVLGPATDAWRLAGTDAEIHACDVGDAPALASVLERVDPQVVFSLAVSRADDAGTLVTTNVGAVAQLLELTSSRGARLVHLGSATEYGPGAGRLRESDPLQPATPYGASKAAATLLCRAFAASRGADVVVLRPFAVYGPWDRGERLVQRALEAALTGAELPLTPPGFRRDWVFVGDVAEACLRVAASDVAAGEVLNVAAGEEAAPEDVAALVGEIAGRPLRTSPGAVRPRPWDRERWTADVSKLERTLGWRPPTALRDGLRQTYDWFVEQRVAAAR